MPKTKMSKRCKVVDSAKDVQQQRQIKSRADYSMAILGKAFVYNGSGRFLNIQVPKKVLS
jgi:hypothetical protein